MMQEIDTLVQVVDSVVPVVTAVDSLAQAVGGELGLQVAAWITLALGAALKVVVDFGKKLSDKFAAAPDAVKAIAVVLFGQAVAWIGATTGVVIPGDLTTLDTTFSGALITLVSMGFHGLFKAIGIKKVV